MDDETLYEAVMQRCAAGGDFEAIVLAGLWSLDSDYVQSVIEEFKRKEEKEGK